MWGGATAAFRIDVAMELLLSNDKTRKQQNAQVNCRAAALLATSLNNRKWSVSKGFGNRIWPWDMQHGIPINCSL